VSYQQTRLDLMLDTGAIETETPEFWLKDHVPNLIFGPKSTVSSRTPVQPATDAVLPPEQYFNE